MNPFAEMNTGKSSAKWNMFNFHNHLLEWISLSAKFFLERKYPDSFEALTIVYLDVHGFFSEPEQKKLKALFNTALDSNNKYIQSNQNYELIKQKIKNATYKPDLTIYSSLIHFRIELLDLMTKYDLTIPKINKSTEGAGEQ